MITVVYFWQIKKVFLPIAILFMAFHKFALMRLPGVSFVKLLGTGKGESFTPRIQMLRYLASLRVYLKTESMRKPSNFRIF